MHDSIANNQSFSSLALRSELFKNLSSLGYEKMTPVQVLSLPNMLDLRDVIVQAKTGSGKTVAFGLALLNKIKVDWFAVQGLVLCPTRELAEQVCQVLRRLARLMPNVKILNCSGGIPMKPQLDSLKHSAHIIVGTPGRIQKHLSKGSLHLDYVNTLVLDEADRMLDMGFFDDIKQIISYFPQHRQTLLFSATFTDPIKDIAKQFMQTPQEILVEFAPEEYEIEQYFYEVLSKDDKFVLLRSILFHYKPTSALIFCNTKQQTIDLTDKLMKFGFSVVALHGDMEQMDRDLAVVCFANQSKSILVATDVAARGLDIKELPAVINFELAFEPDVHIHRIGRTGRAGNKGLAISLTTPADAQRICLIEENLGQSITWGKQEALSCVDEKIVYPDMVTLSLSAGKKDKIRPGDILGALIKDAGLPVESIGKINIAALQSYVAIHRNHVDKALQYLENGKLKGRRIQVRKK